MKIILDGKEFAYNPEIEKTIAAKLKNENLVIHSIKAGGVDLINATLEEALSKPVPGRIISIETRPAEDLLWESMKDAREYLPRLKAGILKLRDSFLEGNNDVFISKVDAALEGLEWLGLTFQAFISQKHPAHGERVFTMEYARLLSSLQELEAGLQAEKLENVCDIFENDIVCFLDKMFPLAEEFLGMENS